MCFFYWCGLLCFFFYHSLRRQSMQRDGKEKKRERRREEKKKHKYVDLTEKSFQSKRQYCFMCMRFLPYSGFAFNFRNALSLSACITQILSTIKATAWTKTHTQKKRTHREAENNRMKQMICTHSPQHPNQLICFTLISLCGSNENGDSTDCFAVFRKRYCDYETLWLWWEKEADMPVPIKHLF